MSAILLKSASFMLLIVMGLLLRRCGLFGDGDYHILVRVVMNVTLPAAVITGFTGISLSPSLLLVMLIGFVANVLLLGLGWLATRGSSTAARVFAMLNLTGYNVGAFAIPYLQTFIGPAGVVTACMFDAGNAIICTGGGYAVTSAATATGDKLTPRAMLGRLFSSVPFDVYLVLLTMAVVGLRLPDWFLTLIAPAGAANAGIAMFMIGLMFRWDSRPGYLRSALAVIAGRNIFGAVATAFVWFCTSLPTDIKQVVTILLFAPIAVMSTAFTERCGGDAGLAGFTSSLSIVVSVVIITTLVTCGFGG